MRILVTGAEGFVGGHLILELEQRGHELCGTYLFEPSDEHSIEWLMCDLTNSADVESTVRKSRPDAVIHLAAVSHVPDAQARTEAAFATNVIGVDHLLRALSDRDGDCHVLVISSGEIYGEIEQSQLPCAESGPIAPRNIYGVTKVCSEHVAYYYAREFGMKVSVIRPFNQLGPGQADRFVCASFARQIARVMLGLDEGALHVGNLEVQRDFTDVRDMCRAYAMAVEMGIGVGPFNVCSGNAVSIRTIVETLIELSGISVEIVVDEKRVRKSDISIMIGDSGLFRRNTGWKPEIPLLKSLDETLNDWLEKERPSEGDSGRMNRA